MLVMALGACASQGINPPPENALSREAKLRQLDTWGLRAKLGIRATGSKPQSGLVNWKQRGERYTARISGPFGLGATKLISEPGLATLESAGQTRRTAANANALFAQATGISAPLDELPDWLKGLPGPSPYSELSRDPTTGATSAFEQDGWLVKYPKYRQFNGQLMPSKIVAERDGTRLTLIISRWTLAE